MQRANVDLLRIELRESDKLTSFDCAQSDRQTERSRSLFLTLLTLNKRQVSDENFPCHQNTKIHETKKREK
jgi:hypothetical protein